MEKHIIGENGISYTLGADGLYYPDLQLPEGTRYEIGRYGRMWWEYLKSYHRGQYIKLLLEGKLNDHLHEVDGECYERMVCLGKNNNNIIAISYSWGDFCRSRLLRRMD